MKRTWLIFLLDAFLLVLCAFPVYSQEETPWSMFHHDVRHTGHSMNIGPAIGTLKWSYSCSLPVLSSPSIDSKGIIYFGSEDSMLYAVENDGSLKWTFPAGGEVTSTPAIRSDGTIFFGSSDGYLYAVAPNGVGQWSYRTGAAILSSPVIDNKNRNVYVGSTDSKLYAFKHSTSLFMELLWVKTLGGSIESSPALSSDGSKVFIGSNDGKIYAYTSQGEFAWATNATGAPIKSSPAISDSGLDFFVGSDNGYLYLGNCNYGSLYWSYYAGGSIRATPAVGSDGVVYIGASTGIFHAVQDGYYKWSYPPIGSSIGSISSSAAVDGNGNIYVGTDSGKVFSFDPNGNVRWTYQTGNIINMSSPAIDKDGTIYIGSYDKKLHAVNEIPTPTLTQTPTLTPTITLTITPTLSPTDTPNFTPSPSPTKTFTDTNTNTKTQTQTPTNPPTKTPTPTATPTPTFEDFKPILTDAGVQPERGSQSDLFEYFVKYKDEDGGTPPLKRIYINGTYRTMEFRSGERWDGLYHLSVPGSELKIGENGFWFEFTDDEGNPVKLPEQGAFNGPWVDAIPSMTPTETPTITPTPTGDDNDPPEVIITNPLDRERVSGIVLIRISAADQSGINSVEVNIDDGSGSTKWLRCPLVGSKWEYPWNTRDYDDLFFVKLQA
ncbi:PQQ-binding-like beta-propeller repeat protein, partial [bacterium]|nr:PQQ-binding-like beta-propeller repeat protein [bacterium]